MTVCGRCGKQCRGGAGNPEARLLKQSSKGFCADCALTQFLKRNEPLGSLIETQGVDILRNKEVKLQIARLLIIGKSDASINEIDTERVIANWKLPI